MSDGGKGSAPRPFSVSNEEYAKRWDAIFGRDVDVVVIDEVTTEQVDDEQNGLTQKDTD
jgi:hypothetical protein